MPKATSSASTSARRHTPLHVALDQDAHLAQFGRVSRKTGKKSSKGKARDEDEDESKTQDPRMSRKILDLARDQQNEVMNEMRTKRDDIDEDDEEETEGGPSRGPRPIAVRAVDDEDDDLPPDAGSDEEIVEEYYEEDDEFEIDPEDHVTLDALARRLGGSGGPGVEGNLMSLSRAAEKDGDDEGMMAGMDAALQAGPGEGEGEGGKTLADLIFAKIHEAESGGGVLEDLRRREAAARDDGPPDPRVGLNPKVVEVYTKVGYLLSRYKSGPLPRALKILPSLPHWAQLLALTAPPKWTPHATEACTKIFVSNLKPDQVKVYLQGVLLEKVRDNMAEGTLKKKAGGGKLDVHLYESLKKGLYKPAAFFKGILFPLCEEGCSLQEATIVASVLAKVSVPVLHSAAALLRLASMDYTGPNSLFIRVLLDKKYALPYKVVDALVFHFIRLANSPRSKDGEDKLPVLWHQSLLVFVQRYGSDLTPDQKDVLLDVIRARPHHKISPEIRRELVMSVVRGEPRPEEMEGADVEMR